MATTAYTTDQYKSIVNRISNEVFGEGDLDAIEEIFAADFVQHGPFAEDVRGISGMIENVEMVRGAFPDLNIVENTVIGEGEYVLLHHVLTGTHEGPFLGIEPTGADVALEAMVLHRFEDGLVAEVWLVADTMGLLEQLGVIEPLAQ